MGYDYCPLAIRGKDIALSHKLCVSYLTRKTYWLTNRAWTIAPKPRTSQH